MDDISVYSWGLGLVITDFNPALEREKTTEVEWDSYNEKWEEYLKKLDKQTEKLIKRKEAEALELMSKHAQKLEEKIKALVPNPKKLKYFELVTPYRQPILQDLMDGKDVEESFDDAIFDVVTEWYSD